MKRLTLNLMIGIASLITALNLTFINAHAESNIVYDIGNMTASGNLQHNCARYLNRQHDATTHWDECAICGKHYNTVSHSYTRTWSSGYESCLYDNYWIDTCNACGYQKTGRKECHWNNETYCIYATNSTGAADLRHYRRCQVCNSIVTGPFIDKYGNYNYAGQTTWSSGACMHGDIQLTCYAPVGLTCDVCKQPSVGYHKTCSSAYTYSVQNDRVNLKGTSHREVYCSFCGLKFEDIYDTQVLYKQGRDWAYIDKRNIVAKNGAYARDTDRIHAGGELASYSDNFQQSYTGTATNFTYTQTGVINPAKVPRQRVIRDWPYHYMYHGDGIVHNPAHSFLFSEFAEFDAPVVNTPTITTTSSNKGWRTSVNIYNSGYEQHSDRVTYKFVTPEGRVDYQGSCATGPILYNKTFSFNINPSLEAGPEGRTYKVQYVDNYGNTKEQNVQLFYVDAKPPTMTTSSAPWNNTSWSQAKSTTITATDYGSGDVIFSYNNPMDAAFKPMDKNVNTYTQPLTVKASGMVIGAEGKTLKAHFKDEVGNVLSTPVTVYYLDGEKPTAKFISQALRVGYADIKMTGSDGRGSGLANWGYAKGKPNAEIQWQGSPEFKISDTDYYYFYTIDAVGNVSEPTPAEFIIVSYDMNFDYNRPKTKSVLQGEIPESINYVYGQPLSHLPLPELSGYIFKGWTVNGSYISGKTLYNWTSDMTAVAVWEPIKYKVLWNDNQGNIYQNGAYYSYDQDYSALTQSATGFKKDGYYIAKWNTSPEEPKKNHGYYCDEDYPYPSLSVQYMRNLTNEDNATIELYAIWKPNKYIITLHSNQTPDRTEVLNAQYDTQIKLPGQIYESDHTFLGWDPSPNTIAHAQYQPYEFVNNLTTVRNGNVDLYAIWDAVPQISAPGYITIGKKLLPHDYNGNIDKEALSVLLNTYADAYDYEYQLRYGSNKIPIGQNNGYTFGIISIDESVVDAGNNNMVITYCVTDDAGNYATATTLLVVSEQLTDILIR